MLLTRLLLVLAPGITAAPTRSQQPALVPEATAPANDTGWKRAAYTLRSDVLGETVQLQVTLPPSFGRAERTYPVILLLDGQYYLEAARDIIRALVASGQVPEVVLIGVTSRDRRVDFTPRAIRLPDVGESARADQYIEFLERELLPAAAASLRAGKPRVLLGHSHGGMLVIHALATRPEAFPWAIALDPPTHHEEGFLAREFLSTLAREKRPELRLVTLRVSFGWSDEQWTAVKAAAHAGDVLSHGAVDSETHESMFFPGCYRALQLVFADASTVRTLQLAPLEIEEHYRALAVRYGAEVIPPESACRTTVEDFLMEGRGARAGDWLQRWVAAYGAPADHEALLARVKEVAAQGEPKESVAGLLALPRATPEEMRAHLGEWRGSTWVESGSRMGPPSERRLRFYVEEGVVQGELKAEDGPTIRLEYLRVRTDGGLEFGFRNGMRPRALIVHEEAVPGGKLEGRSVFRGIRFTLPHGEVHPVHHFEFERAPAAK